MLQRLFFIGFMLAATSSMAEPLEFLGSESFPNQDGKDFRIPAGATVEKIKQDKKSVQVRYKDQVVNIPTEKFSTYFESPENSLNACLQSSQKKSERITKPQTACEGSTKDETCPLKKSGEDTRREVLAQVILDCSPTEDLPIVKRSETVSLEDYKNSCKEKSKEKKKPAKEKTKTTANPTVKTTWTAPIPLPTCTDEEAKIINENSRKKHEAMKAACPDKEPDLKSLVLVDPEPKCMLAAAPNDKITKVVLHASEGPPMSGPHQLFCDYAPTGWDDIPYHYYIAKDPETKKWVVYEGRSLKYQGAHVRANLNADSIGIAIAGDYKPGGATPNHPYVVSEAPPAEAIQLAQSLVAKLKKEYPSIKDIQGHGEALYEGNNCHKNCPGPGCQYVVNRLKEKYFGSTNEDAK